MGEIKYKVGEEEKPYFDKDFLVKRFLNLTPDQVAMNKKYKDIEAKEAGKKEGGEKKDEITL
jgi:hypothetical protein